MLVLVCCLAALYVASASKPLFRGRPEVSTRDLCVYLIPWQDFKGKAQETEFPYELLVDDISPSSLVQRLTLTIRSKTNDSLISEFLVQAREMDFFSNPFGIFLPQPSVKVMDCLGGRNNTATHTDKSLKESVSMVWYSPFGFDEPFRFYVTVAKSKGIFWVAKESEIIEYTVKPETTTWDLYGYSDE